MKPNAMLLCAVLGAALALSACGHPRPRNYQAAKHGPIVCLGNSITAGYVLPENQAFPSLLAQKTGRVVINAGVPGDTTSDALARLDADVLSKNPGLVIVELGGNDYLKQVPLAQTKSNLTEIISKTQAQGAMVAVADPGGTLILRGHSEVFEQVSNAHEALFISRLIGNVLQNPSLKADQVHPNQEGQLVLAEKIFRAIKPYLK